ncbi:hypothetical protein Tco_0842200 [Tanacetum coccineum]|uniref:Uncharacterized protein n=1 Tax=Tanacetum coccineum TaxID=301880 RepID=A0ABQ5B1W6_9ASTR
MAPMALLDSKVKLSDSPDCWESSGFSVASARRIIDENLLLGNASIEKQGFHHIFKFGNVGRNTGGRRARTHFGNNRFAS